MGADVVMHSVTKYIGGHSDIIGGAIMLNDKALYDRLFFVMKSMGTGMCAFDSWMAMRSSKTLEVRFLRQQSNAIAVAKAMASHKNVQKIIFPGLKSHPQYELALRQQRGPGAMISFLVKGDIKVTTHFLTNLKLFTLAESLGGVESLAEAPSVMTHGSVPPEVRKMLGIEDNFIRLSIGCETEQDLVNDVIQALDKL